MKNNFVGCLMKRAIKLVLLAVLVLVFCGMVGCVGLSGNKVPDRPQLEAFKHGIMMSPYGPVVVVPLPEAEKFNKNFQVLKDHIEKLEKIIGGEKYQPKPWPGKKPEPPEPPEPVKPPVPKVESRG